MSTLGDDDGTTAPQQRLDDFWENLITKKPGKITNIFPPSLYANLLRQPHKPRPFQGRSAADSYQIAAEECRSRVKHIVRECHRTNEKYTDPDFDIEGDEGTGNCLEGIKKWYKADEADNDNASSKSSDYSPRSVHRIDWIFEKPSFTVDGFSSSDVQQGANGDCWFLAAVATICSNPSLMHKVCVERDEECGVYGFVFFRDGEWIWTVVDDNLYLKSPDWDALGDEFDASGMKERRYKKNEQTGSEALYFSSCADQDETWLPLLEKAYAKVHGDYDAISGGWSGEGVEDLTGGVTTKILANRVLSRERLWKELLEVNKQFLFSASSPSAYGDDSHSRKGLALGHAYSIIKAVEEEDEDGNKQRLVLIRNPWGKRAWNGIGEWNGAWSDGAKEWSPYWMNKLNYRFGDDGVFWMSYDDLLKRFDLLDRTRLFDKNWTVVQTWTSVSVAWVTGYLNTKFQVVIKKSGPTVFVLAQLDERYFFGLEGKYYFDLHFLLQEEGAEPGDHIVRARGAWFGNRSISAEVDLQPGTYEVLPKLVAWKDDDRPDVYEVVKKVADKNPQKLRQIGMNYDIANAKGVTKSTEEEKKKREQKKKEAEETKRKEKEEAEKEKAEFEAWKKERREKQEKIEAEKKIGEKKDPEKQDDNKNDADKKVAGKEDGETKVDDKKKTSATEDTKKTNEASIDKPTIPGKATGPFAVPDDEVEVKANHDAPAEDSEPGASPDDDPAPATAPAPTPAPADSTQKPWNAVCVLGLRVYSMDPEVSIKLVEPKNPEEAAVLDADGAAPAGATM